MALTLQMIAVLTGKIVIVVEPLISLIQDQIKQLPTSIIGIHYKSSIPNIFQQVTRSNLGKNHYMSI
jgi:superfamily II DNA helicase RecQ